VPWNKPETSVSKGNTWSEQGIRKGNSPKQ